MENSEKGFSSVSVGKTVLVIILAVCVLVVAQLSAAGIGSLPVLLGAPAAVGNVVGGILYPVFTLLLLWVLCNKVIKLPLADFRITKKVKIKPLWAISAFLMPVLVVGVFLLMPGHFEISGSSAKEIWSVITGVVVFIGFGAGIVEEAVFRGIIMGVLEKRTNKWVAITVPSVLFGCLHISTDYDIMSCIQVIAAGSLVGIMFSLVAYESRSIWSDALMHSIWNIIAGGLILNIGAEVNENTPFTYVLDNNSFLITGGDFGIEASVIALIAYLIFAVLAIIMIRKKNA